MILGLSNKSRFSKPLKVVTGNNLDFTIEHQFLNFSLFIFAIGYLISLPQNIIANLPLYLNISNAVTIILSTSLYILSRLKIWRFELVIKLYFVIYLVSISFVWFFNGGLFGVAPILYLMFLSYIIFLTEGKLRSIFLSCNAINLFLLITIEYYYPQLICSYPNRWSQFEDMSITYFFTASYSAILVFVSKKLYQQEKINTKDLIEQYRANSNKLKKAYSDKMECLSIREKEVFQLIIEGKSNKEIADRFSISLGTVKNHVTSIYKKIDVTKRSEIVNME